MGLMVFHGIWESTLKFSKKYKILTQPIEIRKIVLRKEPLTLHHLRKGSIDVGLLHENHHKINLIAGEDLLLNEGIVPILWIASYTTT